MSVRLVRGGKPARDNATWHAAEAREHRPAARFQSRLIRTDDGLGVALGGVNRLDQRRATAARVKRAAKQLGARRDGNGAPLSRQASQQELDRRGSLWMWMRHELFGQRLQFLGIAPRAQLTLGFVAS